MKILLSAAIVVLLGITAHGQQAHHRNPAKGLRINARLSGYPHQHHPDYNVPVSKGMFMAEANGRPLYQCHSKNNKLHGVWMSWYANGVLRDSGNLVKGLPDGEWKFFDEEGTVTAVRNYSADKYLRITGEIMRASPKSVLYPLTSLYKKDPLSASRYLWSGYSFGLAHPRLFPGITELVQSNIQEGPYHPVYHRSLHHGLFLNKGNNGVTIDSGYYSNGLKEGLWIHRNEQGSGEEGRYIHGLRRDNWKQTNAAGRLIRLIHYDADGKIAWQKSYN